MNKVILVGRTTTDIEARTANTTEVATFSLAVDTGFGEHKKTNFIPCVAFDKLATNISTLVKKGTKVLLEGELVQNQYTTKEGVKVNEIKVKVINFEFCEAKKN